MSGCVGYHLSEIPRRSARKAGTPIRTAHPASRCLLFESQASASCIAAGRSTKFVNKFYARPIYGSYRLATTKTEETQDIMGIRREGEEEKTGTRLHRVSGAPKCLEGTRTLGIN
jgi:hypothetical protein